MQTVDETRRQRLELLINEFGSIAALNAKMDMDRTDATFSQIRNQAVHSKSGKPRVMGDDLARRIEEKLGLERGWMDTPPGAELYARGEQLEHLHQVAEQLLPYQIDQWIAIGKTLALPGAEQTQELERVRQKHDGSSAENQQTTQAAAAPRESLTIAASARHRDGRLFDPTARKRQSGAVDDDNEVGRAVGERNARGGRRGK